MPMIRRRKPRSVRDVLSGLGLSAEAIEEAEQAGTDELLAIDAVVLPEPGKFTLEELATKVGADVAVVQMLWRALGFVDAVEGERSFNKRDVAILKSFVELTADGIVNPDIALQVARVVGLSMAQVATAMMDAGADRAGQRRELVAGGDASVMAEYDAGSLAVRAGELLPFMGEVIDYSFRRHLRAAARRRVVLAATEGGESQVVGFADLVRFTELSLQLDDHELNDLVGRFDRLVNAVVVGHGGRIVKMIGDAAMFAVVGPVQAALVALELDAAVSRDEQMGGLRIGMASGPVLARDGDLYGPIVNVASRLGTFGRAGAINVNQSLRDAIARDDRFSLRSLGNRRLRHIGDVRVYRLRPGRPHA